MRHLTARMHRASRLNSTAAISPRPVHWFGGAIVAGALVAAAPATAQGSQTYTPAPLPAIPVAEPPSTPLPAAALPHNLAQPAIAPSEAPSSALTTLPATPATAANAGQTRADAARPAAAAAMPENLSPWAMFMSAAIVVKAVMIGLGLASVATWTVWFAKTVELMLARRRARKVHRALVDAPSLLAAAIATGRSNRGFPVTLVDEAVAEVRASANLPANGIKERVAFSLSRLEAAAGRKIGRGTSILATIGAVAPFVGLFGTVWGIMNSFIGISLAHTTNLAVVAPGIAEALLATAMGLVAAIPAVVIYNAFARSIAAYRAMLGDVSAEIMRHLSHDLDREAVGTRPVAVLPVAAE